MIAPGLATMLCVLTTDADLPAVGLDAALRAAVRVTFDRLDTDGCMSTNDTVLLLASGASGIRPDPEEFTALLTDVCADLARQLQLDAEGAGKMIAVEVIGAASEDDAVVAGRAVARTALDRGPGALCLRRSRASWPWARSRAGVRRWSLISLDLGLRRILRGLLQRPDPGKELAEYPCSVGEGTSDQRRPGDLTQPGGDRRRAHPLLFL